MRGKVWFRSFTRATALSALPLALAAAISQVGFCAEGIFQGKVVNPPLDEAVAPGWIFVQGRNHLLRRVEVIHAVIVFGQQVPLSQRRKCGPECLEEGQEIRVTADQDRAGEWRARRVEILRLTSHNGQAAGINRLPAQPGSISRGRDYTFGAADLTKLNTALAGAAG
jgi:hypothetical protein